MYINFTDENGNNYPLYYHKTVVGDEYLTDKYIVRPDGSKEGVLADASLIIHIDSGKEGVCDGASVVRRVVVGEIAIIRQKEDKGKTTIIKWHEKDLPEPNRRIVIFNGSFREGDTFQTHDGKLYVDCNHNAQEINAGILWCYLSEIEIKEGEQTMTKEELEREINGNVLLTSKDNNKNNRRINEYIREKHPDLRNRVIFKNDKNTGRVTIEKILTEEELQERRINHDKIRNYCSIQQNIKRIMANRGMH